ncbi:MAG: hypothetical protein OXC42_01770 [Gammaproteobacteria bacterium]|nr:hypothetical protein [Gammaproteobacteria bacterium]
MVENDFEIDVIRSGTVILGPDVTCDGFHCNRDVRVQTHIHSDHMADFETSKGRVLVMSPCVRELLTFDHPDFEFRTNIRELSAGDQFHYGNSTISIVAAGHMLGASQVLVVLDDGTRLGYSGDFSWPLDKVIKVDALVVDATYGKPGSGYNYSQTEVEEKFVELSKKLLGNGPIHLMAHTAVIERALMILSTADIQDSVPIIANRKLCASIKVHQKYGWPIDEPICVDTKDGHNALANGRYVRCWQLSEGGRVDGIVEGSTVKLSKYRAEQPVMQYGDQAYRCGLSAHADFAGTLEYVEKSGAQYVVTDNCRGRNDRGRILANVLSNELGIKCRPSSNARVHKWG